MTQQVVCVQIYIGGRNELLLDSTSANVSQADEEVPKNETETDQNGVEENESSSDDDSDECSVDDNDDIREALSSMNEEENTLSSAEIPRTKNEVIEDKKNNDINVEISESDELRAVGEIMSVVASEYTVVVKSYPTSTPLDEGSVLCLDNRKILGKVSELFGPLNNPFYVVNYMQDDAKNSLDKEIPLEASSETKQDSQAIRQGTSVFVAVQHSSYVTPQSLSAIRNMKGSDASNMWDEEVRFLRFFDINMFIVKVGVGRR